jgi:two-component system OmpR family response regulator
MPSLLVADDDPSLREVVRYTFERAGFAVRLVSDGAAAVREVAREAPDLVILDITMPELDGIDACRTIRASSRVPIVFLSSRDDELDRVLGLEIGADDYVTKPFSPRELLARVKAVLRRSLPSPTGAAPPEQLCAGALRIDLGQHRAWAGEAELDLTVTEFALLRVLVARPGRAYTRDELVDRAYGEGHHVSERTLDSHVRRIRAKLREAGHDPIETVHGLGYRLRA